jgi:heme/copper-type cytochrome/quinol oxidase subunit 2
VGIAFIPFQGAPPPAADRTIRVEAGSFTYDPPTISVNRGDRVTLELVSIDVLHGLYIDGYDLELISEPGQTARMTFTADRPGSFRLRCSVTCGDLHPFMIGVLRVGNNEILWRAAGLSFLALFAVFYFYRKPAM